MDIENHTIILNKTEEEKIMKKRLMAIFAAILITASLTACGNGKNEEGTTGGKDIDINIETPTTNGSEQNEGSEIPSESESDTEDPNKIMNPGEYAYVSYETAKQIQVLSATGAATLRTEDYVEVTSVPNGTVLDCIGFSNDENKYWSQVVYEGEICYIATHLVTTIIDLDDGFVEVSKTLIKNDGSLKIRIAPDMNSEVIGYISAGEEVVIIAENTTEGWYKVVFTPYGTTEETTGYVVSNPEYYEPEIEISVPDGYSAYIDNDIAFVYPENWESVSESDTIRLDRQTGDNYVIAYEAYTADHDKYFSLTNEEFAEMFIPLYESMGYIITEYNVKHESKGDVSVAVISFTNTVDGQTVYHYMYIFVTKSNKVCTFTVTETSLESEIAETIYESLIIAK